MEDYHKILLFKESVNNDSFLTSLLDPMLHIGKEYSHLFRDGVDSNNRYFYIMDSYFNNNIKKKIQNNPAKMLGYLMEYLKKFHDVSFIEKKSYITFNSYSYKDKIYF